jgi:hypothetical protein
MKMAYSVSVAVTNQYQQLFIGIITDRRLAAIFKPAKC